MTGRDIFVKANIWQPTDGWFRSKTTFKALADRRGCGSSACLRAGEICVCDIHGSLGLPQPTVSRHLAYLRKSGLVETRKDGLWVHYRLANPARPGHAGAARRRHPRHRPRRIRQSRPEASREANRRHAAPDGPKRPPTALLLLASARGTRTRHSARTTHVARLSRRSARRRQRA